MKTANIIAKYKVSSRTYKRMKVLEGIMAGMKPSKEKDQIIREIFRQGKWENKYGIMED